jgi:hypothetical protein
MWRNKEEILDWLYEKPVESRDEVEIREDTVEATKGNSSRWGKGHVMLVFGGFVMRKLGGVGMC